MLQLANHRFLLKDRGIRRMATPEKQDAVDALRLGLYGPTHRIQTGLLNLLFTAASLLIVGQAASLAEARSAFAQAIPEILLLDVEDPQAIDYPQLQELRQLLPATLLVIHAARHRRGVLDRLYRMGVRGFVTEDVGLAVLVETLSAVRANPHLFVVRIKS
jgi:DNA-binding NarL/FixJ family response regulator